MPRAPRTPSVNETLGLFAAIAQSLTPAALDGYCAGNQPSGEPLAPKYRAAVVAAAEEERARRAADVAA